MIKNELLVRVTGLSYFYRWHPEVALRYLPIVDRLNRLDKKLKILEIGSGGLGITPYLKREVTGVDVTFSPPYHPLLKRVKGSATEMPFPNSSFDLVICVDMLEHLRTKARVKAINEMLRVARKHIYLAVPCGQSSLRQDLFLDRYFQEKKGKRYSFLKEHLNFGLPEEKDLYDTIMKQAKERRKRVSIEVLGNENLKIQSFLMKGLMTENFLINLFFRKLLLFALPLLRLFNQEPTYRKLFYIDIYSS